MPPLAETQRDLGRAVVTGDSGGILSLLVGGRDPEKRLAIHHRHYETSLVTALLGKFPATTWLVGAPFITQTARHFTREHPPQAPCVAEYGDGFPEFLSTRPGADGVPYLRGFAELEWHIGHVAVAVARPALVLEEVAVVDPDVLAGSVLTLQPGLRYLQALWPVDDLMRLYLTNTAPHQLSFAPADVWIEVRGARGEFHISRLDSAEFRFRTGILEGRSVGEAADVALETNAAFDPGRALVALVSDRLVTAMGRVRPEEP